MILDFLGGPNVMTGSLKSREESQRNLKNDKDSSVIAAWRDRGPHGKCGKVKNSTSDSVPQASDENHSGW